MKSLISTVFLVLALLPATLYADVKSDMASGDMSLVKVLQNALDSGMSMEAAVQAMVEADPSQSNAVVAAAIVTAPGEYAAIVNGAVGGLSATGHGGDAGAIANVTKVAIVASNGKNADAIANATQVAAANVGADTSGIQTAKTAATGSLQGTTGSAVIGTLVTPSSISGSAGGGGAAATANDIQTILTQRETAQNTINTIKTQLANAGFSDADVLAAVTSIESKLNQQSTNLTAIATSLQSLADKISGGQVTATDVLAGLNDAIASASGGATTS